MRVWASVLVCVFSLFVSQMMIDDGSGGTTCRWNEYGNFFEWWDDLGPTGRSCVG